MAESKELTSLLMKVKEESEKSWLKAQHSEAKIMASGPITSWQIDEETVGTDRLCILGSKSLQIVIAAMKLKDAYSLDSVKAMATHSSTLA